MAQKVRRHHIAKNLVFGGYVEASFYAIDEATGELVKVRTGYVNGMCWSIPNRQPTRAQRNYS
jgi:hypothetical protein